MARDIGHAPTLMYAMFFGIGTGILYGDYLKANELADELLALSEEKAAALWKAASLAFKGCTSVLTGNALAAVDQITSGLKAWRSTGATAFMPLYLAFLASAHAAIGQLDDAWRCIEEAITAAASEVWWAAEVNRVAGELALVGPQPDEMRAAAYFERALSIARQQQAKSWELRASISLARLWRDQGKEQQARELLTPVYGWFTEGFDTRDLKEANALLEELAA
jgi:predicted ATPase